MTSEERQAFEKREQELLDGCRIKSEEQFLDECVKAGISENWFAFTCDRAGLPW